MVRQHLHRNLLNSTETPVYVHRLGDINILSNKACSYFPQYFQKEVVYEFVCIFLYLLPPNSLNQHITYNNNNKQLVKDANIQEIVSCCFFNAFQIIYLRIKLGTDILLFR